MGDVVTKERDISQAQYLDLVYSQSGTLYDLIPNDSRPNTDPSKPHIETHVDSVAGSIQPPSTTNPAKRMSANSTTTSSALTISAKVNVIQSSQTPNNKKKGKGKNKNPGNQQGNPKATTTENDNKGKRKDKYPCLLCGGDHFMKDFPHREEISKFLKSNPTPTVLTYPFPSQQQLVDHMSNQGTSSSTE